MRSLTPVQKGEGEWAKTYLLTLAVTAFVLVHGAVPEKQHWQGLCKDRGLFYLISMSTWKSSSSSEAV